MPGHTLTLTQGQPAPGPGLTGTRRAAAAETARPRGRGETPALLSRHRLPALPCPAVPATCPLRVLPASTLLAAAHAAGTLPGTRSVRLLKCPHSRPCPHGVPHAAHPALPAVPAARVRAMERAPFRPYLSSWRRGGSHRTDGAAGLPPGAAGGGALLPTAGPCPRRGPCCAAPAAAARPRSSAAGGTQLSPPAPRSPARPRGAAAQPRLPPSAPGKGPRPGPGGGGGLGVPPEDGVGAVAPRGCRTPSRGVPGLRGRGEWGLSVGNSPGRELQGTRQ